MNREQIYKTFENCDAILKGHFKLSSGMHSEYYIQCAKLLMHPEKAGELCKILADKIRATLSATPLPEGGVGGGSIDIVVSPAMGGVVVGYEVARQLGVPAIFCERVDSKFEFRRGFELPQGARVLIVEDVVTTAKSSYETIDCIKTHGGIPIAEACLIDRSSGTHGLPFPLIALLELAVPIYEPGNLPKHLDGIEAIKPGSRYLNKVS